MRGLQFGIGQSLSRFPLEKSNVLTWIDSPLVPGILKDKSENGNDITISENLITNPNCELDYGWPNQATTTPLINERSSEFSHSGTYSRKLSLSGASGAQSLPFTVKTGEVPSYDFWILPTTGTASIRFLIKNGSGTTNAVAVNLGNLPNGAWYHVTSDTIGTYTETSGGSNAIIVVYISSGTRTLYIDDFNFRIANVNTLSLPINTAISSTLVNAAKYYTSGNPLSVRLDQIAYNENNQLFFSNSFKLLIYNKQVYGSTLIKAIDWTNYDFFETIGSRVLVKKDGSGDYLDIQSANAGITTATAINPVAIDIGDDFEITDKALFVFDGTYYRYCDIKANVYLVGVGGTRTLDFSPPNTLSDAEVTVTEPFALRHNGGFKGVHVIGENIRYPLHLDDIDNNAVQVFKNSTFEHKGNQSIIDYRIANSLPYANVYQGMRGIGMGSSSGLKQVFDNVTVIGIRGMSTHNNVNFSAGHYLQFLRSKFIANGAYEANANPNSLLLESFNVSCLNSDIKCLDEFNNCTFNAPMTFNASVYDTGAVAGISYQLADTDIKMSGCTGFVFDNQATLGGALMITSANSAGSISITGGTAQSVIMPTPDTVGNSAIGRLEVGEWSRNTGTKLGVRLGDCSSVNKTLTLTINGTINKTVTFNQNFTAQTNAQVLAFINAALGVDATASLYQRAKDYLPTILT